MTLSDTLARVALDPALEPIREKVLAGERLSREDGLTLYRTRDIFTVGELANIVRERLHGRIAYYNINRHINYTNYCVLRCKFCSFYRRYEHRHEGTEARRHEGTVGRSDGTAAALPLLAATDAPRPILSGVLGPDERGPGYEYSLNEIVGLAIEAYEHGATEVHIVGGLHPRLPFEFYVDMCRAIRTACPRIHIKAFTAIEIVHFTRISKPRLSIAEVLTRLREAGLDCLPGGGAEIFDDRVHDEAFKNKVGEKHWFDVHRSAHELGIPSNATMLYGHIETIEERISHMIKLREHQDESLARIASSEYRTANDNCAGPVVPAERPGNSTLAIRHSAFQCCIPLSFIPEGSEFGHLPGPTGLDDLRTLAIARLMLDNFPHIKAFWIMQTPGLSQLALSWGCDDIDGTVVWYDITKREGHGTTHQELDVSDLKRLIREAGFEPVERDTLYRALSPHPAPGRAPAVPV
jgi:aminodeoxyfutalosine synthase